MRDGTPMVGAISFQCACGQTLLRSGQHEVQQTALCPDCGRLWAVRVVELAFEGLELKD